MPIFKFRYRIRAIRKYVLFVLCLFSGCIGNQDRNSAKKMVIGFSQCTMIDEWRKAMVEEMKREITYFRDYKIELIVKDARDNNVKQIEDINELVSKGIDLLIVSPNEAEPLTPMVEKIYNKGIPVIVIDRKINSTEYSAYIGADNLAIGREAGYFATELLKGKGKILEITGLKGSTPAKERSKGFHEVIDKYPKIRTIKTIGGDWQEAKTLKLTDSLFRIFNDFNLIFAHNDFMANAASKSARKYNIKPFILGVDGMNTPSGGVSMVIHGSIDGSIYYPSGGDKAIQLAVQILTGKSYEKFIDLDTYRIDKSNARTLWLQGLQLRDQQNKIDKQSDLLNKLSETLNRREILLLLTYTTIVLLILIVVIIFLSLRNKNKMNKMLDEKNKTIINQNQIITRQRNDTIDLLMVAEEARENKVRLFTDLSHEFRTVVTLITSPIQDILNLSHDELLRNKVKVLQRSAERLERLTNSILKFKRIDNNKYHLTYFSANIAQFITNIIDAFQEQVEKKNIELVSEISDEVYVEFDLGVMEKVMYNLLSNAIKFTKRFGVVTVSLLSEDSIIVIKVRDTGIGIPKSELPFLFNRFYKVNNPNQSFDSGSIGVGLALSKELIQLHGGRISVESIEDQGTCFTISIPKFHRNPDADKSNMFPGLFNLNFNHKPLSEKDKTILVIEDNQDLLNIISDLLSKYYNVITAYNGKEGLNLTIKKLPDLVLSDI